jgi:glucan endo-1,3-alpha-glucosidase
MVSGILGGSLYFRGCWLTGLGNWADYGESSYLGPIRSDQPNSQAWVNGFPHTAWLSMNLYYVSTRSPTAPITDLPHTSLHQATAFKTGAWPTIKKDQIVIWARPHPYNVTPTAPTLSRPTRWQYTNDNLYALVFAIADCQVTLTSGSNVRTFSVNAGLTRMSMSMAPGGISGVMARSGKTVAQYIGGPGFQYTTKPKDYNYNYFVGYSG